MNKNPFTLEGKRILVTGAGSGIGRSIAVTASRLGATVELLDISEAGMEETLSLLDHSDFSANVNFRITA